MQLNMCLQDADEITNSLDPDQTAPLGAVGSGSALFGARPICPNTLEMLYSFKGYLHYWSINLRN